MEGTSFAACGEANDLELVPTKRAAMRGWVFALSVQPTAAMSPRFGGSKGRSPLALLSPHFFGKKWGRRRRPKLRIVRFRAGPKAHSLRWASSPHDDHFVGSPRGPHWARPRGIPQQMTGDHRSPLRTAPPESSRPTGPAVAGASGRMISAPAGLAVVIPPRGRRVRDAAPYACPRALLKVRYPSKIKVAATASTVFLWFFHPLARGVEDAVGLHGGAPLVPQHRLEAAGGLHLPGEGAVQLGPGAPRCRPCCGGSP